MKGEVVAPARFTMQSRQSRWLRRPARQFHAKRRSLPWAIAMRLDRSTVKLDEMPGNAESQSEAAMFPRERGISLAETLKPVAFASRRRDRD